MSCQIYLFSHYETKSKRYLILWWEVIFYNLSCSPHHNMSLKLVNAVVYWAFCLDVETSQCSFLLTFLLRIFFFNVYKIGLFLLFSFWSWSESSWNIKIYSLLLGEETLSWRINNQVLRKYLKIVLCAIEK